LKYRWSPTISTDADASIAVKKKKKRDDEAQRYTFIVITIP
jgi:hypothetical protein